MQGREWLLQLAAINRTWVSAYLSAQRTFRLGARSAGQMYGQIFGQPNRPAGCTASDNPVWPADGPAECTAVHAAGRMYGLVRQTPPPPATTCLWTTTPHPSFQLASLELAPAPPLNNKTLVVATDRLLCAPPSVCTALCAHRLVCGPPAPLCFGSLRNVGAKY